MEHTELLQRIADNFIDVGQVVIGNKCKGLSGPLYMVVEGRGYVVATDARLILFCLCPGPVKVIEAAELSQESIDTLRRYYEPPAGNPDGVPNLSRYRVKVQELRSFCGPSTWEDPCPACRGTSKESDYVSCSFCDDAGVVGHEARYGCVLGLPLNRNFLAQILEAFHAEEYVDLSTGLLSCGPQEREKPLRGLWVVGRDARGILAQMNPSPLEAEKWAQAPSFPPAAPILGVTLPGSGKTGHALGTPTRRRRRSPPSRS